MDQGEYRSRPANAERKRQNGGRRENPRDPELSKCVPNIAD